MAYPLHIGIDMKQNKMTIAELAAITRNTRNAIKLPGVKVTQLSQQATQVYAELIEWDCPLNILNALKVEV